MYALLLILSGGLRNMVMAFTGTLSCGCADRRSQKILSRKHSSSRSGPLVTFAANRPNGVGFAVS